MRNLAVVAVEQDKKLCIYPVYRMWIDIATAIVSLILILIFAYFIVFVLEMAGLYKPNSNTIIHRYEVGDGMEGGVGLVDVGLVSGGGGGGGGVRSPMTI